MTSLICGGERVMVHGAVHGLGSCAGIPRWNSVVMVSKEKFGTTLKTFER